MTIRADNYAEINENFSLKNGEIIEKRYNLVSTTDLVSTSLPSPISAEELTLRNDDVKKNLGPNYTVIGRDSRSRLWLSENTNSETSIGVLVENNFVSVANFPFQFREIIFDFYNNSFILKSNGMDFLMTMDGVHIFENSLPQDIAGAFFDGSNWNIVTSEKTLTYKNNSWQENIRFTHFMDLDGVWRAGFISENDSNKLSLSNFSKEKWSVLLLLNRENGKIYEIARGLKLEKFINFQNALYVKTVDNLFQLKIPEIWS